MSNFSLLDIESAGSPNQMVAAVATPQGDTRLPEFNRSDPELWFRLVESILDSRKITAQRARMNAIIPYIVPIQDDVRDFFCKDDFFTDLNVYDSFKQIALQRCGPSLRSRINKLLANENLGFTKPSAIIRKMRSLGGDFASEIMLKELFLQRLPADYRAALNASEDLPLDQLGMRADSFYEFKKSGYNQTTSTCSPTIDHESNNINIVDPLPDIISAIKEMVIENKNALSQLRNAVLDRQDFRPHDYYQPPYGPPRENFRRSRQRVRFNPSRPRSSSRSSSRSRQPSPHSVSICRYHLTYGNEARRCWPPCTFNSTKENPEN